MYLREVVQHACLKANLCPDLIVGMGNSKYNSITTLGSRNMSMITCSTFLCCLPCFYNMTCIFLIYGQLDICGQVETFAQFGVVFLLFALGLEFSSAKVHY